MAVRVLLHYALEVPDPAVGETFYRDFGLVNEGGEAVWCACDPRVSRGRQFCSAQGRRSGSSTRP